MKRLLSAACLLMVTSCGATVKVEGGGASTDDGTSFGGFGNGSSDDGNTDDGSGGFFVGDGGFSMGDGGTPNQPPTPDCYEESTALYLEPDYFTGVQIGQGACSSEQIGAVFDACLNTNMPDACEAFIGASPQNQACADCIMGSEPGPIAIPVAVVGDNLTYLMAYACIAHFEGQPECEVPLQSLVLCALSACDQCNADTEEWGECASWSIDEPDVCDVIEVPPSCNALLVVRTVPAECGGAATSLEEAYTALASLYCGAP